MDDPPHHARNTLLWRLTYSVIALSMIPVGLVARAMRDEADSATIGGFIITYLGDTLWAVMFFFLFAAALPRKATATLGVFTLVFTLGIETSQLYHGEPLATLRDFKPTRFLLGTNFLWSDIACLAVGTLLAAGLHARLPKPGSINAS